MTFNQLFSCSKESESWTTPKTKATYAMQLRAYSYIYIS